MEAMVKTQETGPENPRFATKKKCKKKSVMIWWILLGFSLACETSVCPCGDAI